MTARKIRESAPPAKAETPAQPLPDAHKIDEAQRSLYSRTDGPKEGERVRLAPHDDPVSQGWGGTGAGSGQDSAADAVIGAAESLTQTVKMNRRKIMQAFVVSTLVFFVAATAFSAYTLFKDANSVSLEDVDLRVSAPISVGGGEELPLEIVVENKNNADIESATLLIRFPEGTRDAADKTTEYLRVSEPLGTIEAGEQKTYIAKAVLYGEEQAAKKIAISLDYRIKGSNATFSKDKEIEVKLSAAPLAVQVATLEEVSTDQQFELAVTVSSNSQSVVSSVVLEAVYPFGFSFKSADPAPVGSENSNWRLGDIAPGEKKVIRIRGSLTGQNDDDRAFRFNIGSADKLDPRHIGTNYVTSVTEVSIKKPFIGLGVRFEGNATDDLTISGGQPVSVNIPWKNNLGTRVADVVIEVKAKGATLDRNTISARSGHYRSYDDTIVFDRAEDYSLALLNPGQEGVSAFAFRFIGPTEAAANFLQNQEVVIEASVRGKRLSGDTVMESLESTVSQKVKVSTSIDLSSRASYTGTSITNFGPMPPKANQETRYTVTWSLTNTFNAVSGVRVVAPPLPTYVRWTGAVYPPTEKIRVVEDGSIVWDVGDMKPYTGYATSPKEVTFQVAILPSITQIGTSPTLVRPAEAVATDRFTGDSLTATAPGVTTNIVTDPAFKQNDGIVVE